MPYGPEEQKKPSSLFGFLNKLKDSSKEKEQKEEGKKAKKTKGKKEKPGKTVSYGPPPTQKPKPVIDYVSDYGPPPLNFDEDDLVYKPKDHDGDDELEDSVCYGPPSSFEDEFLKIKLVDEDDELEDNVKYGPPSSFGLEDDVIKPLEDVIKPKDNDDLIDSVCYGPPSYFGLEEGPPEDFKGFTLTLSDDVPKEN